METQEARSSPQTRARIGGVLYLIIIVIEGLGEAFVRSRLIVSGDPTATVERIRASEFLWRVGIAGELFMLVRGFSVAEVFAPVDANRAYFADRGCAA